MKKPFPSSIGCFAILVAASLLFFAGSAQAVIVGFQGPYDPANWTLTTNGGDGYVDTAGAPSLITLFGSNTASNSQIFTDFTTLAVGDGTVSFVWNYTALEPSANWDRFGYLIDGNFFQLSNNGGPQNQLGTASFGVLDGQTFGFRIDAIDDGGSLAYTTISSFEVAPVPEPGTWVAAALLAGGTGFMRWRKRAKVA
jgi:hypothetical protein